MRSDGRPKATPTPAEKKPDRKIAAIGLSSGKIADQLVAGIGADAHERAGAERELPGIAGEDVEAERGQRIDQHRDQQRLEGEFAGGEREDDEGEARG